MKKIAFISLFCLLALVTILASCETGLGVSNRFEGVWVTHVSNFTVRIIGNSDHTYVQEVLVFEEVAQHEEGKYSISGNNIAFESAFNTINPNFYFMGKIYTGTLLSNKQLKIARELYNDSFIFNKQ